MKKTNTTKIKKKTKKVGSKPKPKASKMAKPAKKQEEVMDRPTLIGIARLLQGAGSTVKALKSDDDALLQRKVTMSLHELPSAEVVKQLEAIDPVKLVNGLKLDCLGIFIDLSDVSCVRCSDAKSCATKFITSIRGGGFAHLNGAATDKTEVKAEPAKSHVTPVTRFEAERLVFVRDVPNQNPEDDDYHDTVQRVLDDQPETLAELREIVEEDFTIDGDGDFMKFVTAMRDPVKGIIKLDVDLTDKDKAALREAGYDV